MAPGQSKRFTPIGEGLGGPGPGAASGSMPISAGPPTMSTQGFGGGTSISNNSIQSARTPMRPRQSVAPSRDGGISRNPAHMERLATEIREYLRIHDYSRIMDSPLEDRTFRSPTQKDFKNMFQFLYLRMDPAYTFLKGIDIEAPFLLKAMRCPFAEFVSRSSLVAVGGHNWHIFLSILNWMVIVNQTIDRANELMENGSGLDGEDRDLQSEEESISKFLDEYAQKSYSILLDSQRGRGNGDFSEVRQEVEQNLARMSGHLLQQREHLDMELEEKAARLAHVKQDADDLESLEVRNKALQVDIANFETHIKEVRETVRRRDAKIENLRASVDETQAKAEDAQKENAELKRRIEEQGVSVQEIDALNNQRMTLERSREGIDHQCDALMREVITLEEEAQRQFRNLDSAVRAHNSLVYTIYALVKDADLSEQQAATVTIHDPISNLEGPIDKCDFELVKQTLLERKRLINKGIIDLRNLSATLESESENAFDAYRRAVEQHDTRSSRLRFVKMSYQQAVERIAIRNHNWNEQCKALEEQAIQIKQQHTDILAQLQQRVSDAEMKHDQIIREISLAKSQMNDQILQLADYVLNFKTSVLTTIRDYRSAIEADQESLNTFIAAEHDAAA